MATVKTAISLRESLFQRVDALAEEMHVSRSRLFVVALEELLERRQNQQLLRKINAAYDDGPSPQEQTLRRHMRCHHKRIVEGEW